jgi:hypothetical protein
MENEIRSFLDQHNIVFEQHLDEADNRIFNFDSELEIGVFPTWVTVEERGITIVLNSPLRILADDRLRVASYMEQLNRADKLFGQFLIDTDSGEVFYQGAFHIEEGADLEQCLMRSVQETESLLPDILGLAFGDEDSKLPFAPTHEPGTWVRFTEDQFIETDNIIIEGMLGQVIDHPHAHYICTPGISTMIRPLGLDVEYGYFNTTFTALDGEPTEDERAKSEELRKAAFSIYEEKYGYSGYARLGTKLVRQEKLAKEMDHSTERVVDWFEEGGQEKHIKGTMKRIRKVLEALEKHPNGEAAQKLAARVEDANVDSENIPELMGAVSAWFEQGMEQERIILQKKRIDE